MAFVSCKNFSNKIKELLSSINEKQDKLKGCDDNPLAVDAKVPTCDEMKEAIENNRVHFSSLGFDGLGTKESPISLVYDHNTLQMTDKGLTVFFPECRADVIDVGGKYSILSTNNVLVASNATITVPKLEVGQELMIIQDGTDPVTLVAAKGVKLIAPLGGSLKLAGDNAVVTLLATADGVVRVFGQTA